MSKLEVPDFDQSRYSNRQLAGPPVAVIVLALLVIGATFAMTGTPVALDTEFTGGTELRVVAPDAGTAVDEPFSAEIQSVQPVQTEENTYIVTFDNTVDPETQKQLAEDAGFEVPMSSSTSPTFGQSTQRMALIGVGIAFLGMSLVVFGLFRTFVPSIAVVVSAFGDIVVPVALMNIFGIELSLGTVAALLMLIGYSVDSDILLNNHVLRRTGEFYESVQVAMRTGVTMTLTSIAAMTVMAIVAYLFGIQLMSSIGLILVFGLATDLMNTYMMNVTLLRWYKFEGVAR
ncbi:protein translocase subunit SecF [Halanaeroarchaeum sulfurireducens]|uniref:Protein-export membrane protein SecF n=1 Tax=Halanaeroarchaeum sulfurireducens TaxID=1604004 RepID=A0A0F7P929_9EURY|nr:protein translocase subunit SecF [Halanaeroarchaeum sulfurireducens]AKH96695.1 preprotein translocase subunit SecF [Halanaeroarchaeum sulfurireducens]ALG81097.1 preprotein translocase subunit SecF [Halanaeroarchaeum sulfurireducens]